MFVSKADHYGRVIIWKNLSGLEHLMKMYSLLFSVQQRHILERGGALPSSVSVQSETHHLCPKRPIRVALCMLANPVQSLIINLHFWSGSCLRVYYHSSDDWMITSNVSLSLLLPNHLGPFLKTRARHCISVQTLPILKATVHWEEIPTLQSEMAKDIPNETNAWVLMKIKHGLFGKLRWL